MSKPAAIAGDYTDLRFIRSRKVAQIVVEIPIEAAGSFVEAFGTPLPDRSVPVALARIEPSALKKQLTDSIDHEKQKHSWKELSRPQQAGIACSEQRFWRFLNEERKYNCQSADDAAEAVREICGVSSRSMLDTKDARYKWDALHSAFIAWFQVPA